MAEFPEQNDPRDERDDRDDRPRRRDRDYDDRDDRPRRREPQPNGIATAALVFGILALCGGITAIPGIICGAIGISRSSQRGTGQGAAIAGLVMSILGLLIGIPISIGLLLPAVQKVREAASRMQSANNLKQISNGIMTYDMANNKLPPQAICDKDGRKLLSWRVAILPYIEQQQLYDQFKLDEPWDSPTNKPLIARMPKTYWKPNSNFPATAGETYYKVFAGKNTPFAMKTVGGQLQSEWSLTALIGSPRGTSNLILCVEGGDPVIWTKPDDFDYDPNGPLPDFKPSYSGTFLAVKGDGMVVTISKNFSQSAMRANIDPKSTSLEYLP